MFRSVCRLCLSVFAGCVHCWSFFFFAVRFLFLACVVCFVQYHFDNGYVLTFNLLLQYSGLRLFQVFDIICFRCSVHYGAFSLTSCFLCCGTCVLSLFRCSIICFRCSIHYGASVLLSVLRYLCAFSFFAGYCFPCALRYDLQTYNLVLEIAGNYLNSLYVANFACLLACLLL